MIKDIKKTVLDLTKNLKKKEEKNIKIKKIWQQSVNKDIIKNTEIVQIKNKTITIKTKTTTWKQELLLVKKEILKNLQQQTKQNIIKEIKII